MGRQIKKIKNLSRHLSREQPNVPKGEIAVQMKLDNDIRRFDSSKDGILMLAVQDGNIFSSVHMDGEDLVECFMRLFDGDKEIGRMASLALQSLAVDRDYEEYAKERKGRPALFDSHNRRLD